MFLSPSILLITSVLLSTPLTGQANLTLIAKGTIPQDTKALIVQGRVLGYWGKEQVVLQKNRVFIPEEEQVINVLSFHASVGYLFLVLTTSKSPTPGEIRVHYRSVDTTGSVLAHWSQIQSNDVGLPEIHLFSDYFLFLHPENQTVDIFSLSGDRISHQQLFTNPDWNHEQKLIYLPNGEDRPELVGMTSANLTASQNTSLFQIDAQFQIQLKTNLPLTVPYFAEWSPNGQQFFIGTRSGGSPEQQIPYLLVYGSQYQPVLEPYRLNGIPHFARWWQNKVLLVFQDHLTLIDPENPLKKETIPTFSGTFPLYVTIYENMCFLFTSEKIQYQSQGIRYEGLQCQTIDLQTGFSQQRTLTPAPYSHIYFFPPGNFPPGHKRILTIQLDQECYFYRLK